MATVKLTIRKPKTLIEGWTGFLTIPSNGERRELIDYCGGAPVAFSTRDALIRAATREAQTMTRAGSVA